MSWTTSLPCPAVRRCPTLPSVLPWIFLCQCAVLPPLFMGPLVWVRFCCKVRRCLPLLANCDWAGYVLYELCSSYLGICSFRSCVCVCLFPLTVVSCIVVFIWLSYTSFEVSLFVLCALVNTPWTVAWSLRPWFILAGVHLHELDCCFLLERQVMRPSPTNTRRAVTFTDSHAHDAGGGVISRDGVF